MSRPPCALHSNMERDAAMQRQYAMLLQQRRPRCVMEAEEARSRHVMLAARDTFSVVRRRAREQRLAARSARSAFLPSALQGAALPEYARMVCAAAMRAALQRRMK